MIADTFIKRPITAMVISLVIVILGVLCIFTLPINQYPNITPPAVSVSQRCQGLSMNISPIVLIKDVIPPGPGVNPESLPILPSGPHDVAQ